MPAALKRVVHVHPMHVGSRVRRAVDESGLHRESTADGSLIVEMLKKRRKNVRYKCTFSALTVPGLLRLMARVADGSPCSDRVGKKRRAFEIKALPETHRAYDKESVSFGLFATRDIPKGDVVCDYASRAYVTDRKGDTDRSDMYTVEVNEKRKRKKPLYVHGNPLANAGAMMNHSEDAFNAELDPIVVPQVQVLVRTIVEVERGQEICIHYGDGYFAEPVEDGMWEVEAFLAVSRGRCLVKWKGFPASEATWEPSSALKRQLSQYDELVSSVSRRRRSGAC